MQYTIDTSTRVELNWNARAKERKVQNVRNLISTWKYEVAYNRAMGIIPELLDKPVETAAAQYIAEVYRVIAEYDPSVVVKEVKFISADKNGDLQIKVVIDV